MKPCLFFNNVYEWLDEIKVHDPILSHIVVKPFPTAQERTRVALPPLTRGEAFLVEGQTAFVCALAPEGYNVSHLGVTPFRGCRRNLILLPEAQNVWSVLQIVGVTHQLKGRHDYIQAGGLRLFGATAYDGLLWDVMFDFFYETDRVDVTLFASPARANPYKEPDGRKNVVATRLRDPAVLAGVGEVFGYVERQ